MGLFVSRSELSNKPRIDILFNALRIGGSQTYYLQVACKLIESGYKVQVFAKPGLMTRAFRNEGIKVRHVLWLEGSHNTPMNYRRVISSLIGFGVGIFLRLYWVITPPVVAICSQPWPLKMTADSLPRNVRLVALVHGFTEVEFPPPNKMSTLSRVDHILCVSEETANKLQPSCPSKVEVLGNFFDGEVFWRSFKPAETPRVFDENQMVSISTLTKNKVDIIETAMRLMSIDRSMRLTIVGDGDERERLQQLSKELNLGQRVIFVGSVVDSRPFIDSAALVLGVGRVVLETASRGVPVVIAGDGKIFGLLTPENFQIAQRFNFTGRAPSAQKLTVENLKQNLELSLSFPESQLLKLSSLASKVGEIDRLMRTFG